MKLETTLKRTKPIWAEAAGESNHRETAKPRALPSDFWTSLISINLVPYRPASHWARRVVQNCEVLEVSASGYL
ncbi:hypothetical protein [Rhodoferax ferrireducens]|uniref:hypothetical protein n=1 Tax=Rhodoferax ferrireducens TaxID=192843 RepID=UPI00140FA884|nr:hypothetical protein [Rhodoferax ferrireducens]